MFFRRGRIAWLALILVLWTATGATAATLDPKIINQGDVDLIQIQTNLVNYQFSTRGAVLESAFIYFNTFNTAPNELVPDVNTEPDTMFRTFEFPGAMNFPFQLNLDDEDSVYEFSIERETDDLIELKFTRVVDQLEITKRYVVFNDPYYRVQFRLSLKNLGDAGLTLDDGYTLTLTSGLASVKDAKEVYLVNGKSTQTLPAPPYAFGGVGFLGQGLAIFLKNETSASDANATIMPWAGVNARQQKLLGAKVDKIELGPGQAADYQYLLYAGRWKYVLMDESGLGEVAGNGPFSQLLVWTIVGLNWLFGVTGNYGWAIILFTIITRILFFPLLRQQFHSMAKMREVQPKIMKLRERYPGLGELRKTHKDLDAAEMQARARENREKLNKKMMELYQREGVNPLGGCLPSLLQMPFLILLWRTILYSAEAIHYSPGFMWLNDLSQPDPLYILVVITAGVMMLQTKLTPQMSTGGQNQMLMMWIMPVFMAIFLRDFPAGLWLYYFLTTVIQVLQQMIINWEIDQKKPVTVGAVAGGDAEVLVDDEGT